jgi:beta-lactamase class D
MTDRITAVTVLPNGWDVHGKTGTGFPLAAGGSLDEEHAYGWFVGWATKGERSIVLARLIQDEHPESIRAGLRAREAFMQELPLMLEKTEMHDGH